MPYVRPKKRPKPVRQAYPSDLTEAEWLLLEPLLPVEAGAGAAAHPLVSGVAERHIVRLARRGEVAGVAA